MAVNIPGYRQVRKRHFMDDSGDRGFQLQYKHQSYADLKAAADGIRQGDEVETGWVVKTWDIEGVPGGGGVLSVNCVPADTYTPEGGSSSQYPKDETWTCKGVRNDVSILAFCGPSEGANPLRTHIELWQKETDASVADADKYHKNDNEVVELTEPDKALVAKIRKGIDSVMRFYPVLSRNRKYDTCPDTMLVNLGLIDTPPTPSTYIDNPNIPQASRKKVKKPRNITTIISDHQWVKVQDDTVEQGDGSFIRTESWMGIKKNGAGDSPWDQDLYGANGWPMPYQGT